MSPQTSKLIRLFTLVASVAFFSIWPFPVIVQAQEVPCQVGLTALPAAAELKGFRLGMTMGQVKAHVPFVVFGPTEALGGSKTTINPAYDPRLDKSNFPDVRSISLDFLDGRLVSLWIGYDIGFKWVTIDAFVNGISQSLTLPNAWSTWKARGKQMTCTDFQLMVSLIAQSPSFRIVDRAADEVLTARRVAAAEEEGSAPVEEDAESAEILGDSKTRIYYPPRCKPEKEIAETNRVVFKSVEEAVKAGYKVIRGCS
jgi:hypothetical protein